MNQSLDQYMEMLPPYIGKEIFKFIIPNSSYITFRRYSIYNSDSLYSQKYEIAFIKEKRVVNKEGVYLCRISKKNGKHRYYLTKEYNYDTCDVCGIEWCLSLDCRGNLDHVREYSSVYVGKI